MYSFIVTTTPALLIVSGRVPTENSHSQTGFKENLTKRLFTQMWARAKGNQLEMMQYPVVAKEENSYNS